MGDSAPLKPKGSGQAPAYFLFHVPNFLATELTAPPPRQAGAELLVDYGAEYWAAHHRLHAQLSGLLAVLQPFVAALLGDAGADGDDEDEDEDDEEEGEGEEEDARHEPAMAGEDEATVREGDGGSQDTVPGDASSTAADVAGRGGRPAG